MIKVEFDLNNPAECKRIFELLNGPTDIPAQVDISQYVAAETAAPAAPAAPPAAPVQTANNNVILGAQTTVATGCPFTTQPEFLAYVMGKYNALGAEKGQKIQGIFGQHGYDHLNKIPVEKYPEIYTAIEAIQ